MDSSPLLTSSRYSTRRNRNSHIYSLTGPGSVKPSPHNHPRQVGLRPPGAASFLSELLYHKDRLILLHHTRRREKSGGDFP